jgi:hypothetical protein
MTDDPLEATRHLLKNRLATIRGWVQLIGRERNKPSPDAARLDRYQDQAEVAIMVMQAELDRQLGPRAPRPPGSADVSPR